MLFGRNREELLKMSHELFKKMRKLGKPVFLCVGSDKWVCDSLGPIVAEMLREEYNLKAYVYGGLDYNINAENLMQAVNYIETVHPDNPIFLIDATLDDEIGCVEIKEGCFAGMGKCLPIKRLGAVSILGVVGRKGKNFDLNSTRLKVVMELVKFISTGCFLALDKFDRSKSASMRQISSNINY